MIAYQELRPCAALAGLVECYWTMRGGDAAAPVERVLPDGCVELVLHLGGRFRTWTADGVARAQPAGFVVGPSTRFLLLQAAAGVDTLGARFRPGAARAFLHLPLVELAEQALPIDALLGRSGRELLETVFALRSDRQRVQALEAWLLQRVRSSPPHGLARVHAAVRLALRGHGGAQVAELAQATGVTTRQLQRIFLDDVGLGPKRLLRLARFQAVFKRLEQPTTPGWADLALACGYADQAHLIRDFRDFSGETPASLLRTHGELARRFTSAERLRAFFGAGSD